MAVLNLGGFVGIEWTRRGVVVMVASVVLLGYAVLWYYWQGRNWARQFVMFTSTLTIVNLLAMLVISVVLFVTRREYSPYVLNHAAVAVANAALGAFLLYWLNKRMFASGSENLNQAKYCSELRKGIRLSVGTHHAGLLARNPESTQNPGSQGQLALLIP